MPVIPDDYIFIDNEKCAACELDRLVPRSTAFILINRQVDLTVNTYL